MKSTCTCKCGNIAVAVVAEEAPGNIHPRICDCDYCKTYPSRLISHPTMEIHLSRPLSNLTVDKNGDGLAGFYRCSKCNSLIVVGCLLNRSLRGAVNAQILDCDSRFGDSVDISPKSLKPEEKLERWAKLWGTIFEPGA